MTLTTSSLMLSRRSGSCGQFWRRSLQAVVLGLAIAGLGMPALAQDAKRGDDGPREEVEPFYGDASQSIAIQVPGYRGLEPNISLRYRSSRRDDLLGVGWTLGGFSSIQAASPRRGTPNYNSNDIFILDGQELVPCEAGMVSPSCTTGGTHATKIESYLRIKLDDVANTWEIWSRDGTKTTLTAVAGQEGTPPTIPITLLEAHFDAGAEGFAYSDGLFGGANPQAYASGAWLNGALRVDLGGIDGQAINDISGGWSKSFAVTQEMNVSVSFTYDMYFRKGYDAGEFSQVLVSLNGGAPIVVAELAGGTGSNQETGLQTFTADLGTLQPGTHTLSFGGYNNQKTFNNEYTEIDVDDVVVTGEGEGSPYNFATTYRWAVSEVTDTHGNTVSYSYFNDADEVYPDTIAYNETEILFHWEGRPDSYTRAMGTDTLAETLMRLKTVDVQTSGQRVRAYALTYGAPLPTTEKGLLASVQLYGKDAILDGSGNVTSGTSLPPTSFTYYDDPAAFAASTTWSTAHNAANYKPESMQYADVNGDTLADRIYRSTNNQILVSLSNGTQFGSPAVWANPGGTYKSDQDSYADVDGDGMADLVFRKSNNEIGVYLSDGAGFQAPSSWTAMGGTYYAGQVNVGDVSGDGKADLVFVKVTDSCNDQILTNSTGCLDYNPGPDYPSCPSGWFVQNQWLDTQGCSDGSRYRWRTQCRQCQYTETLHLGISNGTGFEAPVQQFALSSGNNTTYRNDRVKLADVSGDGLLDVSYRTDGNTVKIALSNGDGFLALATWHDFSTSYLPGQLQYADVNGDGTADALFHPVSVGCSQYSRTSTQYYPSCHGDDTIVLQQVSTVHHVSSSGNNEYSYSVLETVCEHCSVSGGQNIQVSLSTGSDFLAPEAWFTGLPNNEEADLVKFADFDGDGRADLSYRNGSNAVTIALSTGSQFTTLATLPAFNGGYQPDQIQLADVNGDGKDDVIHRATNQTTSVALAGPSGVPTQALESVTNVYGGKLTFAYTPSSAWTNTNLPFVVNTVTSVEADDGRGLLATTSYAYAGGLFDAPERRFLGFRTATATLPCIAGETVCPTVTTTFLQDYGAHSKPEKIERRDGAGTLLTEVEHEYTLNGSVIPYKSLNTATTRTIHEGAQSRQTKVTRTFDDYANVTEETFHGDFDQTGDELTGTVEFFANTADFVVSLPARLRQYEGVGTAGTMLTESILYYDGATDPTTPPAGGDVTTAKVWNDDPANTGYVSSTIEYDSFGNVTATVDSLGRRMEIDYDTTYNLFPVESRNPLHATDSRQKTSSNWDVLCGLPETETDLNGGVTTHQYDALCRGFRTDTPGGDFSITSYLDLGDPTAQYTEVETPSADGSGNVWERIYSDGWGRTVRRLAKGPAVGQEIAIDNSYNLRGAVASTTRPYYLGATVFTKSLDYDARDRVIAEQHPDSATSSVAYGIGTAFRSVTTTDEVGHSVTSHYDAYDRRVRKEETLGTGTVVETYSWDLLGRLTGITDDAGNAWAYTYDSLGRVLELDDPDLGVRRSTFDAAGQMLNQIDPKGQVTTFAYDDLGRVLTKTVYNAASAQNDVTTYTYDEARSGYHNVGHLTTATNTVSGVTVGTIKHDHDADGRMVQTTYSIDSKDYIFTTGFDVAGRVLWQTYPDADTSSNADSVGTAGTPITYDAAGRMASIPGVISSADYDARGSVTVFTRANTVATTYTYSPERGWLTGLETLFGSTKIQDLTYQRTDDGQITDVTSFSFGESWTYGYDDLKRLTSAANTDDPTLDRTYAYNTVGNLTSKTGVGTYSYPLPGNPRPHAVTSAGGKDYSYDANGNMTQVTDGTSTVLRELVWDGADRPTAIWHGAAGAVGVDHVAFHYGPDGARWKKVDSATGKITLTLGAIEIQDAGSANPVTVRYLPGSARRTGSGAGATTLWHHKDHLQSIQVVTDDTGAVALRRTHAPYGERLTNPASTFEESLDFIGERLDAETGLLYLNARYYDPVLARFISPDPSDPLGLGVGLNRYSYGLNNPIFYADPSGLFATVDVERYGRERDPGRDGNYGADWGQREADAWEDRAYHRERSRIFAEPKHRKENWTSQQWDRFYHGAERALGITEYDPLEKPKEPYERLGYEPLQPIAVVASIFQARRGKLPKGNKHSSKTPNSNSTGGTGPTDGAPTRRQQNPNDIDMPTERAARREAFRDKNIPTTQANNFQREKVYGESKNLRGPKGEPSERITAKDVNQKNRTIQHHSNGHQFKDNNTFEKRHYHGSRDRHINYPGD